LLITSGVVKTADLTAVNGSGATSGIPAGATKLIGTNGFVSAPLAADIIAIGKIVAIAIAINFLFIFDSSFSGLSAVFSELGFLSYGGNHPRNQALRN
jgi:hypothetical protein